MECYLNVAPDVSSFLSYLTLSTTTIFGLCLFSEQAGRNTTLHSSDTLQLTIASGKTFQDQVTFLDMYCKSMHQGFW